MHELDEQTKAVITSLVNHTPDAEQIERIRRIRDHGRLLAEVIGQDADTSRERSLAFTHLEETVMWAVKSIVLEGTR